jgi:hypothetical protein
MCEKNGNAEEGKGMRSGLENQREGDGGRG